MKFFYKVLIVLNLLTISFIAVNLFVPSGVAKEAKPYYDYAMNIIYDNCNEGEFYNPKMVRIIFAKNLHDDLAIGQCLNLGFRYEISIKREYWDRAKDSDRYSLLMHEVAHCALGLDHSEDENNYMYYMDNYLDLETVTSQFTNDVLRVCSQHRRH